MNLQLADGGMERATLSYYLIPGRFLRRARYRMDIESAAIGKFQGSSTFDYFGALLDVRRQLEKIGVKVLCWGARRDVWPSGMARSMGEGWMAQLQNGGPDQWRTECIFDEADARDVGTVAEQEANAKFPLEKTRRLRGA